MDTLLLNQAPVKKNTNYIEHYHEGELILVPLTSDDCEMDYVFSLDESDSYIWDLFDGEKTIEEIAKTVCRDYHLSYDEAIQELFSFVEELQSFLKK